MFVITCLPVLTLCFSEDSVAKDMMIDVNVLHAAPDAGKTDDFHTGKVLSVNYNYYFRSWLAATAGVFISEEIGSDTFADVVGVYHAVIESQGITFGARAEHSFSDRNKIYVRTGLLFYDTRLTVEEFFAAGLPSGSSSSSTNGQGYYLAFAWGHSFTRHIGFQLELSNMTQLDLFKGESSKPFDLKYTGLSFGASYAF